MTERVATFDKSTFYVTQKLGPKRSRTPEGYLLCEDVAVGRTGVMLYADHEVPIEPNGTGIIQIERHPGDVFRPETMASAHGKPITLQHPGQPIDPENHKTLCRGNMSNIRQGTGMDADVMLADLLVTDRAAIDAIEKDGIEEVSLGYDADYEQIAPGRGVQRNILINHVALVPQGRCGTRCAIGDEAMAPKKDKKSLAARIRAWAKGGTKDDAEAIAQEMEDAEAEEAEEKEKKSMEDAIAGAVGKVLDAALKPIRDDITALKKAAKDENPESEGDPTKDGLILPDTQERLDMAGVQTYLGDGAMSEIQARAEILSPGFRVPTFDAKTATTFDRVTTLCGCQRRALAAAYATDQGKREIEPFLAGQTIAKLPALQLNAAFVGASELAKARNNAGLRASPTRDFGTVKHTADAVANRYAQFGKDQAAGKV